MNRWTYLCRIIVAIVAALIAPTSAPAAPELVRIVVLDTSGSMDGERLDTARRELIGICRQLPPAAETPLIIVPFSEAVGDVQTFQDGRACERYLGKLEAHGGTSIASGLQRAIAELRKYPAARHVCVLLYSDGEDADLTGIRQQEEQLDQLFGARHQQGLQQTVVFCKRWEGANAELLARISSRGHAQVIDAGTLQLLSIGLEPAVTLSQVQWRSAEPTVLDIDLHASIQMLGKVDRRAKLPIRFTCKNRSVLGNRTVEVRPGQAAGPLSLSLKISPPELAAGHIVLDFELSQVPAIPSTTSTPAPITTAVDHLSVPVDLPLRKTHVDLSALLESSGKSDWTDPITGKFNAPVTLTIRAKSDPDLPWPGPIELEIHPLDKCSIANGEQVLQLKAAGVAHIPLSLAFTADDLSKALATAATSRAELAIAITRTPTGTIVEPASLTAAASVPVPPPVRTIIRAGHVQVQPAHWEDLAHCTATVQAQVEFYVDGPLVPDSKITLLCPPAVRRLRLHPSRITAGTNQVQLDFAAQLLPAPQTTTLRFQILPPAETGSLRIIADAALDITLSGPAPVQLALKQNDAVSGTWRATLADTHQWALFRTVPILQGLDRSPSIRDLQAHLRSDDALQVSAPAHLALSTSTEVKCRFPSAQADSFFCDRVAVGHLTVIPLPVSAAVCGSQYQIVLRCEAPFKRLLFYLAAAAAMTVAVFLIARLYTRLTHADG